MYIVVCILGCICFGQAYAQQKNKVPAQVNSIFDDLPIDDPAKNSVLQQGEDSLQKIKNNIFITGITSSSHCFLGEPVLLTYMLYSALQSTSTIERAPSFAGFSVNAMEADNEHVKRKVQHGKTYRVFILQQEQLLPLQEGMLTIDPMWVYNEVSYKIDQRSFHYGGRVAAGPLTISVEAFPLAGRPAGFAGANGNFTLEAITDTVSAAGENNTLHISVRGTGNFASVSMPDVSWPPGCTHFTASIRLQADKQSFPPTGNKIFDIPFVAAKSGTLVIPAIQLIFFDTQKKIYRAASTSPLNVHVTPAPNKPAPQQTPASPLKKQTPFFILLAIVVLVLIPVIFYSRKKSIAKVTPVPATIPAPAQEEIDVREQLAGLTNLASTHDYLAAFKQIYTACLQHATGSISTAEEALLQQVQAKDTALATAAGDLYAQCNNWLYAPGSMDAVTRKEMEQKLVAMCEKMSAVFDTGTPV